MNVERERDRYPSRIEDTPRMTERTDPVVYGSAATGPLEQGELDDYERQGFLLIEGLFSEEEIGMWQNELAQLRDSATTKHRPDVILEPQSRSVRSIFDVHRHNPVFHRLARDARLVNVVTQLLDSPVYFHQSRINYKLEPFCGLEPRPEYIAQRDFTVIEPIDPGVRSRKPRTSRP